jgi:UvrD/REP helicase.
MSKVKILPKDEEINFPEFILLRASAGTGKTHALTLRYTQFLLSEKIKTIHYLRFWPLPLPETQPEK